MQDDNVTWPGTEAFVEAIPAQVEITDESTYRHAITRLQLAQSLRREVKDHYAEISRAATATTKATARARDSVLGKIAPVEEKLQASILSYEQAYQRALDEETREALELSRETGMVPAPLPALHRPKGVHTRTSISVRCVDILALAQAVVAGDVPPTFLRADETQLTRQARSDGPLFAVPGVERVETVSIVTRSEK